MDALMSPKPRSITQTLAPVQENPQVQLATAPTWWDVNTESSGRKFSHYLFIFRRRLWEIFGFVAACTLAVLVISLRSTPVFESTATLDIDRRSPTGIVGQESIQPFNNDADQYIATQMQLITSDSVLRPVELQFELRQRERSWLGQWFSDSEVDPAAPVALEHLEVRRPPNTYLVQISYRSDDRELAANAANAIAESYLEHTYRTRYHAASGLSRYMEKQLDELRARMESSNDALAQFERELNIINPEEQTSILSARMLELNSEFTKAQADRVAKEAAYRSILSGSTDAARASSYSSALDKPLEDYNDALRQFADVRTYLGPNHPEHRAAARRVEEVKGLLETARQSLSATVAIEFEKAADRERMLRATLGETKTELDKVNARSFEYRSLKREADGNRNLYEELLRKIKEATINSSFQNSSARISDHARPGQEPVFPKTRVNVLLAFLLSLGLACTAAVTVDYLDNTIRDPEQVVQTMNTQVVGTLPMVKSWRGKLALTAAASSGALSGEHEDSAISSYGEAVRTLRNSILLADFDNRMRSLLITSASPGEGKSTTALHLAVAHASQSHRTLLIDGDLRRPSVHKRFEVRSEVGLSTVLLEDLDWRQAVVTPQGYTHLDILPAGPSSRQAADLVGPNLAETLAQAAVEYDLVILDAPPLLGFAEPMRMATAVDGVVVVTRAGETNRKAVSSVVDILTRIRANLIGLVLNEVHKQVSDGYYYYSYYRKYYTDRSSENRSRSKEVA